MVVGDGAGNTVTLTLAATADKTSVTVTGDLTGAFGHLAGNGPLTIGGIEVVATDADGDHTTAHVAVEVVDEVPRSEEHTSELQSLMRISLAVLCLKIKKTTKQ